MGVTSQRLGFPLKCFYKGSSLRVYQDKNLILFISHAATPVQLLTSLSTLLHQSIPYSLRTFLYVYFHVLNTDIRTQNFSLLPLKSSITAQCCALDLFLHLAALL